jgi:hypothetical protein
MKDLYTTFKVTLNTSTNKPKFKIGDWLSTLPDNEDKTPAPIFKVDSCLSRYNRDSVKLWQPKLGDWCWFYNADMSIPVFDMFEEVTSKGKYKSLHSHGTQDCCKWNHCEPFIGTLPAKLER